MYGVIVEVKPDPSAKREARAIIRDVVLPRAKQLPGFASGSWLQALDDDRGTAVLLFESEEDARAAAERIRSQVPLAGGRVDVENINTYEVLYQT
jgi:hypothetical protein